MNEFERFIQAQARQFRIVQEALDKAFAPKEELKEEPDERGADVSPEGDY